MTKDQYTIDTLCPFYHHHTTLSISCEGPLRGSSLSLRFTSQHQREAFQRRICCKHQYEHCPLAVVAERKYR